MCHNWDKIMSSLHYHVIVITRRRESCLDPATRTALQGYLSEKVRRMGAELHGSGGVGDHLHMLLTVQPEADLNETIAELKVSSAEWMRAHTHQQGFAWQQNYCAIPVNFVERPAVKDYIAAQERHHQTRTLREELIGLTSKAGMDFGEDLLA